MLQIWLQHTSLHKFVAHKHIGVHKDKFRSHKAALNAQDLLRPQYWFVCYIVWNALYVEYVLRQKHPQHQHDTQFNYGKWFLKHCCKASLLCAAVQVRRRGEHESELPPVYSNRYTKPAQDIHEKMMALRLSGDREAILSLYDPAVLFRVSSGARQDCCNFNEWECLAVL